MAVCKCSMRGNKGFYVCLPQSGRSKELLLLQSSVRAESEGCKGRGKLKGQDGKELSGWMGQPGVRREDQGSGRPGEAGAAAGGGGAVEGAGWGGAVPPGSQGTQLCRRCKAYSL